MENFNEVGKRFSKYLSYKDLGVNQAAKLLGFSGSQISNVKNGKVFGSDKLHNILNVFDDLNPTWLLLGRGDMIFNNKPKLGSKGVPYYDVDFVGGFDTVLNDQSIQPDFFIDFEPFNDSYCWVNITGKSMSPFISHGDIVALQKFNGWRDFILYGEIYAIITGDFRTIKIVTKSQSKDCYTLVPYNKSSEFTQQDIPKDLIKHMFKVKGSIKKFF